jgi:hypothetical protein
MDELKSTRTLVKSPPELWAVCSDAELLAQHLEAFGEIRITRLEPETTVAWEGERASGTVRIEPSGWGTKVTMTAQTVAAEPPPAEQEPAEAPVASTAKPRRGTLFGWFSRRFDSAEQAPEPEPDPEPEPQHDEPPARSSVLDAALDSLGQAHRRPFSHG